MKYIVCDNTIAVRLDVGEEIIESVKKISDAEKITAANVTAIGAVKHAVTGVLDLEKNEYTESVFDEFMELVSLSGNVSRMNGEVYIHLHAAFARSGGAVVGGHLKKAVIGATCELFIQRLDTVIERRVCEETGLNIFDL